MERLTIYFTRGHSSVSVQEKDAERTTAGKTMAKVLEAMNGDDAELLVRFCQAVIECRNGDCKRLEGW